MFVSFYKIYTHNRSIPCLIFLLSNNIFFHMVLFIWQLRMLWRIPTWQPCMMSVMSLSARRPSASTLSNTHWPRRRQRIWSTGRPWHSTLSISCNVFAHLHSVFYGNWFSCVNIFIWEPCSGNPVNCLVHRAWTWGKFGRFKGCDCSMNVCWVLTSQVPIDLIKYLTRPFHICIGAFSSFQELPCMKIQNWIPFLLGMWMVPIHGWIWPGKMDPDFWTTGPLHPMQGCKQIR